MYPKENKADRKLMYACSRCSYKEDAQSGSCVYRNNLITTAGSVPIILYKHYHSLSHTSHAYWCMVTAVSMIIIVIVGK